MLNHSAQSPNQSPAPPTYEDFLAVWDIIAPVGGTVPRDENTKAALWKKIAEDDARLWVAGDAVALVSLDRLAGSGQLEACAWHSVGDREAVAGLLRRIEVWATAIGCGRLTLTGTPEWVAQFQDFKVTAVAGQKDIRR